MMCLYVQHTHTRQHKNFHKPSRTRGTRKALLAFEPAGRRWSLPPFSRSCSGRGPTQPQTSHEEVALKFRCRICGNAEHQEACIRVLYSTLEHRSGA